MFELNKGQRAVSGACAFVIAFILWVQYEDGTLSETPWILAVVAIAALLILALRGPASHRFTTVSEKAAHRKEASPPSVDRMYSSARSIADQFFKALEARTPSGHHSHFVRMFAYIAPLLLFNLKIRGFEETATSEELRRIAREGFRAVYEFEEDLLRMQIPVLSEIVKPSAELAEKHADEVVEQLDQVIGECIGRDKYPLDPIFQEFERLSPRTKDTPEARNKLYWPPFKQFFEIWQVRDFSDFASTQPSSSTKVGPSSLELDVALDELLDHLEKSRPSRPDTALPIETNFKREILREALTRDERRGIANLYDEHLSKRQFEDRKSAIATRVANLKAELGKAPAARIERLFEKLCANRADLIDLKQSVRSQNPDFKEIPDDPAS